MVTAARPHKLIRKYLWCLIPDSGRLLFSLVLSRLLVVNYETMLLFATEVTSCQRAFALNVQLFGKKIKKRRPMAHYVNSWRHRLSMVGGRIQLL